MKVLLWLFVALVCCAAGNRRQEAPVGVRSARSGPWSSPSTWEAKQLPKAGDRVLIRTGHTVTYDVDSSETIRLLRIAGTLSFAPNKDTRLEVGLIRIQAGEDFSEEGFDCEMHLMTPPEGAVRPALEVGTQAAPVEAGKSARIRLVAQEGMDKETSPGIVCCAGRMEFHGAPLSRTWLKLGTPAKAGDTSVTLSEAVTGWRSGDRLILTATTRQSKEKKTFVASVVDRTQTEERVLTGVSGAILTLDKPLTYAHLAEGNYRAEVANLSRNVIVESANPEKARGHTMYHRGSRGSISYAEFRHLGKEGVLGRYSLHFHQCGDSMRGSSVIGASIWDSGNRWLTIHGTNYLVVRDCVGYRSIGHGFFLENGTEVYNILDRNLAVQALNGKPLPKQVVPFDKNDGSGFWWANSLNAFTGNVACDCDEYGYFFQVAKTPVFDPVLSVEQPGGQAKSMDIRTLPFLCFDNNEAHCQRRHSFNLGGGAPFGPPNIGEVSPDAQHPFVIRNLRLWDVHWGIHPAASSVRLEGVDIKNADYGVWRPIYRNHVYQSITMSEVPLKTHFAFVELGKENQPPTQEPSVLIDDFSPISVITEVLTMPLWVRVRGSAADNGTLAQVLVNGQEAKATSPNFATWEVLLPIPSPKYTSLAVDQVGNREKNPHVLIPR